MELSPSSLPYKLYTADEVRVNEPQAADAAGITLGMLMERAGEVCFRAIQKRWPNQQRLLVLSGRGNNGGDGYVIARLAKQHGYGVQLVQVGSPDALTGDAATARDKWLELGAPILSFDEANLEQADIIVDGLLGTGLNKPVQAPMLHLIQVINQLNKPVFSIDVPSGLCATSGRVLGIAMQATVTMTLVARKRGLLTADAPDYVGELLFEDLGLRQVFSDIVPSQTEHVRYANYKHFLQPRPRTAHKGLCGRVYLVGGDLGMPGAIRLAAEACQRTGAGLVHVISRPEHVGAIMANRPELMVIGAQTASPQIIQQIQAADVIVLGPGMGQEAWGVSMLAMGLGCDKPLVVDADALNQLAQQPMTRENWILTPHPGEAARLLGCSVSAVQQDRYWAVTALQQQYGGVVILKGAGTLITDGQTVSVCSVGNPGMASGGTGDVLSGIIGGLLAQGIPLYPAACLAACIHGDAADMAAQQGERGMLASDLYPYIRRLVNPSSD